MKVNMQVSEVLKVFILLASCHQGGAAFLRNNGQVATQSQVVAAPAAAAEPAAEKPAAKPATEAKPAKPAAAPAKPVLPRMPKADHVKEAGGGYKEGSPLYDKQQERKKNGLDGPPPPPPSPFNPSDLFKIHGSPKAHALFGAEGFGTTMIWFLLVALIWVKCLDGRPPSVRAERPNEGAFSYNLIMPPGVLEHCADTEGHHCVLCFCAFCCLPIRMADTYAKQPLPVMPGGFWVSLVVITALFGLSNLTLGLSNLVLLGVAVFYRNKIRQQYGMSRTLMTCIGDCFTWMCCPCCAAIQEARQVEYIEKTKKQMGNAYQHS